MKNVLLQNIIKALWW